MNSNEVVTALLSDKKPEIRKLGVQILADSHIDMAEYLLVEAMADPADVVWKIACNSIKHRQPWLVLKPHRVMPVPHEIYETSFAKAWDSLRTAIRQWLIKQKGNINFKLLKRWLRFPGIIPDIIEELRAAGENDLASRLEVASDLWGRYSNKNRQIILAPTYLCNLDCSYCYAKNWNEDFKKEMTLENLETALNWCVDQGINNLILAGGEPTVYRYFNKLMIMARERRLQVFLTTNMLFSKEVQKKIKPKYVNELICHYDQSLGKNPKRYDLFKYNLESAMSDGMKSYIRYTLTEESDASEYSRVIDLVLQSNTKKLHYSFAFKNIKNNNYFVHYPLGESDNIFERQFAGFVETCHLNKIKLHLCKPIPLCVFSEKNMHKYLFDGTLRSSCTAYRSDYTHNLTINPDLSTFPCTAIGVQGPFINKFKNMNAAGRYHSKILKTLLSFPYSKNCLKCFLYYRGLCQGSCLVEHLNIMKSGPAYA